MFSSGRIAYEIRAYDGTTIGYSRRRYPWSGEQYGPKCIEDIQNKDYPVIHFPRTTVRGLETSVAVVEDIPSAEKLAPLFPTISIMGTDFSLDYATYLRLELGITELVFVLDPDAFGKQYKLMQRLGVAMRSMHAIKVDKDPKDMSPQELEALRDNITAMLGD